MKIVFRWEDRDQAAPPSADLYWTRDLLLEDLAFPDAPSVHRYGQGRIDAHDLDDALRERIEQSLKNGETSGREQVIEMPHLDSQLQYIGTLAWSLVGETRKEKVWIATKMRNSNPDAPLVRLRLADARNVVHFDASDLQSFTQTYRAAWQRWLARIRPSPSLELHIWHRRGWWFVTAPGTTTPLLTVANATAAEIDRYWAGIREALEFFVKADAADVTLNPAFDMTLDDAYRLLGLQPGATPEAVSSAYRALTRQHHPDRGGDLLMMQRLNVARDLIESGGKATTTSSRPSSTPQDERHWDARRDFWWRPQPSGNYTTQDLRRVADWVLSMGLRQVFYRHEVDHVPVDARMGKNTYTRPFGGVARREKLPDGIEADRLADSFERYLPGSQILDIGMTKDLAWVTWIRADRAGPPRYQSVSFERPVKRASKPKGTGMSPTDAADIMRELGLRDVAGGTKYGYWSVPVPGRAEKTGVFVRTSKRTLRLVKRVRKAAGIEDDPLDDEVYYGELTRAQLEQWAKTIRERLGAG